MEILNGFQSHVLLEESEECIYFLYFSFLEITAEGWSHVEHNVIHPEHVLINA